MTSNSPRQLHLNAFGVGYGFHQAAWTDDSVDPLQSWDLDYYRRLVAIAERGKLDALFLQDGPGLSKEDPTIGGNGETKPEPLTLLAALAPLTTHLGLAATFTTTFNEPYNVARYLATLDHFSGGRAGWNIVTSQKALDAQNFGFDTLPPKQERYARSNEFVEVVLGLWDTWQDGALIGDKAAGRLVDPDKVRQLNFRGEYFKVRGPLNVPRSPQGRPVLFQAGSSDIGRDQGARFADVLFTAQTHLGSAQAFYADIKSRARSYGRDPDQVHVVPGLLPVIGSTQAEADEAVAKLDRKVDINKAIVFWREFTGLDFSGIDLQKPVPATVWESAGDNFGSRVAVIRERADNEKLSAFEVIMKASLGVGHNTVVGPPEKVADLIQTWFEGRGADGFNILSLVSPASLEQFVDHVVPILQKRGLFRTEYAGTTLRDHYGLAAI